MTLSMLNSLNRLGVPEFPAKRTRYQQLFKHKTMVLTTDVNEERNPRSDYISPVQVNET